MPKKKTKYDDDSYGKFDDLDKEIIYSEASSDDNDEHNGYDVTVNNYPLEKLQKDFIKLHESKEYKTLMFELKNQMAKKYPEQLRDNLPLVKAHSMSNMLTRGQLRDLITSYEDYINDLYNDFDFPTYEDIEKQMSYFQTSGDFHRIAYFYNPGESYPAKFNQFLDELQLATPERCYIRLKEIFDKIFKTPNASKTFCQKKKMR